MPNNALIVFTGETVDTIKQSGGTSSWVLSPKTMQDVRYVVCTKNRDQAPDNECGVPTVAHGEAFLVGKISGMKEVTRVDNRGRYLIQMSEYAPVSVPDFWIHKRNPTHYTDTKSLSERGIDVGKLKWLSMPIGSEIVVGGPLREVERASVNEGLSIAEAKRGLSVRFEVPEDAVQIVING